MKPVIVEKWPIAFCNSEARTPCWNRVAQQVAAKFGLAPENQWRDFGCFSSWLIEQLIEVAKLLGFFGQSFEMLGTFMVQALTEDRGIWSSNKLFSQTALQLLELISARSPRRFEPPSQLLKPRSKILCSHRQFRSE